MPNWTVEQISEAIVGIIEGAQDQGVVVDDKRLAAQSNIELARILKSQASADDWHGWIITFASIPAQVPDGDCIVVTTYRFFLKYYQRYSENLIGDFTSDIIFKRAVIAANEALNMALNLGLDNLITHLSLQSEGDFDIEEIGGGTVNQLAHTATFTLDVEATNSY